MALPSTNSSLSTIILLALLAVSFVYAQPIRETKTNDQAEPAPAVQPRDPRLIPDTEHYLANVLDLIGVDPIPSDTPTPTIPTPNVQAEHGQPENLEATPVSSSDSVTFTTTIKSNDGKPFENIQIGSGWSGKKKLTASDLPVIFDAVAKELDHRFRDMVDSSDEVGLFK
ncbi:hypothetical protein N7462_000536 [Penicillium macrosclerotiorum]|uniref:uncharacterized protein n=1 Tax=Penicillium macrosclerotiorum TaxID=303699 RepID=UPI002549A4CA|nr:uncharacterized protein N7462_000536 [Penicillium macrosclerotiorum]KAJ5698531.1 hypothetical protein N7462_000536 [Penicillium macrosclerotiorum]